MGELNKKEAHDLVIGGSGAGKSTKARLLGAQKGLPVVELDKAYPEWGDWLGAKVDPMTEASGKQFEKGHPLNKEYLALARKISLDAIQKKTPHIIEGTQLIGLKEHELKGHNLHVVNPSLEQVLKQRNERSDRERAEKGKPPHGEGYRTKRNKLVETLYHYYQPTLKMWEKQGQTNVSVRRATPEEIQSVKLAMEIKYRQHPTADQVTQVPTAVILKGDSDYIKQNPMSGKYYQQIADFLRANKYAVATQSCDSVPAPADLWIGHSAGTRLLKFAPKKTKTLMFGSHRPGAVNHPRDRQELRGVPPSNFHYIFTNAQKDAIMKVIRK